MIENYDFVGEVFALLELEDNLGLLTGWTGIGYDFTENFTENKLFYKAGYSNFNTFFYDPTVYDGTESYFSYGKVQGSDNHFFIDGGFGIIPGSPLVYYENDTEYTTYGLLTFANNSRHPVIAPRVYNALLAVIEGDLTNLGSVPGTEGLVLYPNPGRDFFRIKSAEFETLDAVTVYDLDGKMIFSEKNVVTGSRIDVSRLATAAYLVEIETEAGTVVQRFLKN